MSIPQTAKQQAINVAKIAARESNEVLKSAAEQLSPFPQTEKKEVNKQKLEDPERAPRVEGQKNLSFLNEYKAELNEIRRDNLFKELQSKISEGESVPLENYINELSYEQREVLKAQMEAIRVRIDTQNTNQQKSGIREVVSKKGRQMFNKIKKRNEQHVETRMPPSS